MGFIDYFKKIKEPRRMDKGNFKYPLQEIVFIAVTSSICGISDWEQMHFFAKNEMDWFRKYFEFKNGIPSHDTINRLFALINPKEFCDCFNAWASTLRTKIKNEIIAIDGKNIRGSAQKSKGIKSLQFVSAYAVENSLVLCQEAVNEKSNEITAIPLLLNMFDCNGAIITADALNCQKEIASIIIEKGADYLLALKGNHQELYDQVIAAFIRQSLDSQDTTNDVGHGRVEKRTCSVIKDLQFIDESQNWKSLGSVIKVESERYYKATKKTEKETRYYISSLKSEAKQVNKYVRSHWGIENKLHWMLDVSFNEDASRKLAGNATINYSYVCKTALNILKKGNGKGSFKSQKFKALLNTAERERIMGLF